MKTSIIISGQISGNHKLHNAIRTYEKERTLETPDVDTNEQGDPLENVGTIVLNSSYWDCECKENYIHKKSDTLHCNVCKMDEEDMPDSREDEVQRQIYKII